MPNFWTKTTQYFAEAFNGPRTKDTEFDLKVEEMKVVEKGVISLKAIFQNFLNSTVSIRTLCRDVYSSVKCVYDKNSPYFSISNDIHETHVEMEKFYEELYNNTLKLFSKTTEWNVLFNQAKEQIQKRDESRKVYDHYDEKLEKLYKAKQEKARKNIAETTKDIEFAQRNEVKYKKATEEYIKLSETAYETIQVILDKRYDLINPVLSEFIEEERSFFTRTATVFRKFEGIGSQFKQIAKNIYKKPNTYDPCKFIRGGELIQKHREEERNRSKSPKMQRSGKDNSGNYDNSDNYDDQGNMNDIYRDSNYRHRSQKQEDTWQNRNTGRPVDDNDDPYQGRYHANTINQHRMGDVSNVQDLSGAPISQRGSEYQRQVPRSSNTVSVPYNNNYGGVSQQNVGGANYNRGGGFSNDEFNNNQVAWGNSRNNNPNMVNANVNDFDFGNNQSSEPIPFDFTNMNPIGGNTMNNYRPSPANRQPASGMNTNINTANNNTSSAFTPYSVFSFENEYSDSSKMSGNIQNRNANSTSSAKKTQPANNNITITTNSVSAQIPSNVVYGIVQGIPQAGTGIMNNINLLNNNSQGMNQNNNFNLNRSNQPVNNNPKKSISDDIFKDLF